VVSSLIDALADTFPVTEALVGVEFFRAMASVYVRKNPPTSRILAHYGSTFAAFVESFEPASTVPFLSDVARLEFARVFAYHAADVDSISPAVVQTAFDLEVDGARLVFALHPSVTVLESSYASVSLWAAHQTDGEVDLGELVVESPEDALVLRHATDVATISLPPGAAIFIRALRNQTPLGASACAAIARESTFDLTFALSLLFQNGAVTSIELPDRNEK